MGKINEDVNCYISDSQREILKEVVSNNYIRDNFFLTGGTALSVFYLHHRKSDDLDLFTINNINLNEIDFWIKKQWIDLKKINETSFFLSYLLNNTRVDFVIDKVSNNELRERNYFDNTNFIMIDNIDNINSNKLCVLVARTEIKDYIDFYFINKDNPENLINIYKSASDKDNIFEDPPTVAYQIEEGLKTVMKKKQLTPLMLKKFDENALLEFYKNLTFEIYRM